jgi:hypothetical protein
MLRTVKRVLVIAAIATTGVVASAGTGHAAAAPRFITHVGAAATTTLPTTNLSGKGAKLKWAPKSIKGAPTSTECATAPYSFEILNKTKASQQIVYSGGDLGSPIPAGQGLYVCGSGKIKTTFWPAADPKAILKVTIT